MSKRIGSIRELHSLPFGTKLQIAWPGNGLDGQIVEIDNTADGYQSPLFIEVSCGG